MALSFNRRWRLRFPITLSVALIGLNIALMVCWIVLLAMESYWSAMTIGIVLFALVLIGLVLYTIVTIKEVQLNLRQANFVDSVTHELKSPLASVRLYLETLLLRKVDESQREQFYRVMMDDVDRLDQLISQLLQIGRLDAIVTEAELEDIEMEPLLRRCAEIACRAQHRPPETVKLRVQPAFARGARLAMEMIFGNLIENAVKYGASTPEVEIDVEFIAPDRVITRIADNGEGVPLDLRRKIFGLFFRGGTELERTQKGTGLGLYIVHTLVRKMKGNVTVHGRGRESGSVFEVALPGRLAS
jgi:two-component system, OmpR family, phosphate regulon sensor histidine kinase PhoR